MSPMPRTIISIIPWVLTLVVSPVVAQEGLEITIEPQAAPLDSLFVITLTNRSTEDSYYPCCTLPVITPVGEDWRNVYCPDCPLPCEVIHLRPGESLRHEWQPLKTPCPGNGPAPGIYDVRWKGFSPVLKGFSPVLVGRLELLPDPGRTLEISAEPREVRFGEPVQILLRNTSGGDLCLEAGKLPLSILDPRGFRVLGGAGPLCGPARCCDILDPGESGTFSWTPTESPSLQVWGDIPGRHRLIWSGLGEGSEPHHGETTVLVLPRPDRRLELALSHSEVRPGDLLRITATNPLDVSVWYDTCCHPPVVLDELGQELRCFICPPCPASLDGEVPPGGNLSFGLDVPRRQDCGLTPGRWSVIIGLGLSRGLGAPPVFGYAEILVLPGVERDFRRGDCDGDGRINLTDPIALLGHLFLGSGAPPCPDACDADDSGKLNLTDVTWLLGYLFLGGDPPARPFPDPGPDPTTDALGCDG